ncbi:26S proteasome regulatory subunit Rpn3p [Trichomonascus vanleenenianus]|uniref:proteasome regulatory particle lid subunit RPN3 n=1 Tax=Trichomonascus vanleenenianus TaxID=2268995 RepID=UPI003ECB4215
MDADKPASPVTQNSNADPAVTVELIKQNFVYLEKAVANFDPRFTLRVLRGLPALRKRITLAVLRTVFEEYYPDGDKKSQLLALVPQSDEMEVDKQPQFVVPAELLPEVDVFLHLLLQVWILNNESIDKFKQTCEISVRTLRSYNRRSMDYLGAKVWFYYARAHELTGTLESIRPALLGALRSATLRYDTETQASLISLLLRNYLSTNNVSQAANLVAKTTFPESASNALSARYYYYLARINAIQLDYSGAYNRVTTAIRKAPQTPLAAGFLQTANKLRIVVELLMGDIPEKTAFKENGKSLEAYFAITKAVRVGDIAQFTETCKKYESVLKRDGTYTLVLRLRQNVIKTGIRIMSLTYSKISLKDICLRLQLDSEESAEYIVAKAIRDGVIDAKIDHERGFMQSNEVLDVYSTTEPQHAFHERIKFCISLHNDSVKSMRYSMNSHRVDLKSAEEAREREKELATELQEGSDLDDEEFDL